MNFRKLSLMGLLLACTSFVGCSKDEKPEVINYTTVNMLYDASGSSFLPNTDIYINESNNFVSRGNWLMIDCGTNQKLLNNEAQEIGLAVNQCAAVVGNWIAIVHKDDCYLFPSGKYAIRQDADYYMLQSVAPVTRENKVAGYTIRYYQTEKNSSSFSSSDIYIGSLSPSSRRIEYKLPSTKGEFLEKYNISVDNDVLVVGYHGWSSGNHFLIYRVGNTYVPFRLDVWDN